MKKLVYFLWLNDMSVSRYYWNQGAQNWTTNFSDATKFASEALALDDCEYAERTTKAEVVCQEFLV